MTAKRKWQDNAFWHNDTKEVAEAILGIEDKDGRMITQVLTVRKFSPQGEVNEDFKELIDSLGIEKIDSNTKERRERKTKEREIKTARENSEKSAKELERLFNTKIKILEIECISKTKNKELKKKLRRSKTQVELYMYAQLIMMEENGIGFVTYDANKKD